MESQEVGMIKPVTEVFWGSPKTALYGHHQVSNKFAWRIKDERVLEIRLRRSLVELALPRGERYPNKLDKEIRTEGKQGFIWSD